MRRRLHASAQRREAARGSSLATATGLQIAVLMSVNLNRACRPGLDTELRRWSSTVRQAQHATKDVAELERFSTKSTAKTCKIPHKETSRLNARPFHVNNRRVHTEHNRKRIPARTRSAPSRRSRAVSQRTSSDRSRSLPAYNERPESVRPHARYNAPHGGAARAHGRASARHLLRHAPRVQRGRAPAAGHARVARRHAHASRRRLAYVLLSGLLEEALCTGLKPRGVARCGAAFRKGGAALCVLGIGVC